MEKRPARARRAAALLCLVAGLSACSAAAGRDSAPPTDEPAPRLGVVLYQSRMDLDDRQVQVRVSNEGDGDVVVDRMTLSSTAFADPMTYLKRGSTVRGGGAVDMPVVLSDPVCDGGQGRHTVRVDYRLDDGTTGTMEIPAVDEHGAVERLHAGECFALDVGAVATLSVRGLPRVVPRGDVLTAELVVDVTAVGPGAADLEVVHVAGTTLLQHVDPTTGARLTDGRDVRLRAPGTGTTSIALVLAPGRCDAHALADDKQGTRFRVLVDLDGTRGVVPVVSPDPVRVALYDFVRQACGDASG